MSGGVPPPTARVLVAAQEPTTRGAVVSATAGVNGSVEIAEAVDGAAAWESLSHSSPDLVVWEMALPGLDGRGLLQRLASRPASSARPYVILLCDGIDPVAPATIMREGADDVLATPVRQEEALARVSAGLHRSAQVRCVKERAQQLERLYERQSEFLSWVSHEIRTPLSAILSSANILLRYGHDRPESVERFARVIHQEGQRLTRLINNFLDLAKIEAGQVEWSIAAVPVADLLAHVRESFAALAGERNLRLDASVAPGLDEISTDRDKLTQVLLNLISNAIKHSPDGGTVALRCVEREGGGIRIEVEDEGSGIPPGHEEQIFERFRQLGGDDEHTGSGLGLAISRQIVGHLGGSVWAAKDRGAGALFVVELPHGERGRTGDGAV